MQVDIVGGSLHDLVDIILSFGPWSDQRHLTFQYIPEIGYFVQFPLSHEFTEICEPSVIYPAKFRTVFFSVRFHRSEFI